MQTVDSGGIEALIAQQNELLKQLITVLGPQQQMGFREAPRTRFVYVNRSQPGCLWYWLNDAREVVPILQTALTCVVQKLEFKKAERRGKETWKLHIHCLADRPYSLEMGYDTTIAKSLLSAFAVMATEQLQQPVVIEVQAADSDEVVFGKIYSGGELVFAPWDDDTNWKTVNRRAVENVSAANGLEVVE